MRRSAVLIAVSSLAAALGGCYPAGYTACYTACQAPYPPPYPVAYVPPLPAFPPPFDDPFADYTQRIVTVSPTAGNAQAANTALQTASPWPRYSRNTNIPGNGPNMVRAVEQYEHGARPALAPVVGGVGGGGGGGGGAPLAAGGY